MTALAPLPPEQLARHWAEAEWRGPHVRNPETSEVENLRCACMAVCADAGLPSPDL